MNRSFSALLSCFALASCGSSDNDAGPGGISVEDARALDEAAEKLDAGAKSKVDNAAK